MLEPLQSFVLNFLGAPVALATLKRELQASSDWGTDDVISLSEKISISVTLNDGSILVDLTALDSHDRYKRKRFQFTAMDRMAPAHHDVPVEARDSL